MKVFLLMTLVLLTSFFASAQTPTDLFFSEYVEGSGNNKAIEIYNPTTQTISLSNYWVLRFSNGSSTFTEGGSTHLSGSIAPYKTFILVNGQTTSTPSSPACSPILQAMANQLDGIYPVPTYMNGNDAMALVKTPNGVPPDALMSNVTPVDLFGEIGLGAKIVAETGWSNIKDITVAYKASGKDVTGKVINYIVQAKATDGTSTGPYWMAWTANHSLIRKPNIVTGVKSSPSPFIVTQEWDTLAAVKDTAGYWVYEDIWTNLGKHVCIADPYVSVKKGINESDFSVYPNPVTADRFTIISPAIIKEVTIYSIQGQNLYKQVAKNGSQQVEIRPFTLKKGVYLVKVTSPTNKTVIKKILIN